MSVLYRSRNIALVYGGQNKYSVYFGYNRDENGEVSFSEKKEFTDPLEAWTTYSQSVDCMVRRRISEMKLKEKL